MSEPRQWGQQLDPAGAASLPGPAPVLPPPPPPPAGYGAGGVRETGASGPLWVRWGTFSKTLPWRRAVRVWRDGPWLCVAWAGGGETWSPDHLVRGDVEVAFSATAPTN